MVQTLSSGGHVGLSFSRAHSMGNIKPTMAEEIARAAMSFQRQCSGTVPKSVSVLLGGQTRVVTLNGALSRAEKEMSRSVEGAAQVREFHRLLFQNSASGLYEDLQRILDMEVREGTAETESTKGHFVEVFPSGAIVQVFRPLRPVVTQSWSTAKGENASPAN
jgi:uncharacterized protein YbcI